MSAPPPSADTTDHPPEPAEDSAITALQRAMIGPLNAAHYLPVFARFEASDRAGPGWNWAAALCTLNWMLFRRLWGPALVYLGSLAAGALLVLGVGRLLLHLSPTEELSLLVSLATIAVLVPGGLGDAWLYRQYRARSEKALAVAPTLQEACALLACQASSRRRLLWIGIGNVLLATAIAGAWLVWTHRSRLPQPAPASAVEPARSAGGVVTPEPVAVVSAAASAAQSATPPAAAASAAVAPASEPVASASTPPTPTPAATPVPATAPTSVPVPVATTSEPAAPAVPTSSPASTATAAVPESPASAVSPSAPPAAAPAVAIANPPWYPRPGAMAAYAPRRSAPLPVAPSATVASAPQSRASTPHGPPIAAKRPVGPAAAAKASAPASVPTAKASAPANGGRYVINIGLYGQPANAERVLATLREAAVPTLVQELDMPNGHRTRIRAGPYATRAQADAAAARIRALQLEAVVARE